MYASSEANGLYCKDTQYTPYNITRSDKFSNLLSPKRGTCLSGSSNSANFIQGRNRLFVRKSQTSNHCSFGANQRRSDIQTENFIPGVDINEEDFNVDALNRDLATPSDRNRGSCVESDVIAAKEAALVLQHHKECARKEIKVYHKRSSSEHPNARRRITDMRSTSFADNQELQFFVKTSRRDFSGIYRSQPMPYHFSDTPSPVKITSSKIHRKGRTVTDWLYGDGADAQNPYELDKEAGHPGFASNPHCMNENQPSPPPSSEQPASLPPGGVR